MASMFKKPKPTAAPKPTEDPAAEAARRELAARGRGRASMAAMSTASLSGGMKLGTPSLMGR